jgi:hypothetical protein
MTVKITIFWDVMQCSSVEASVFQKNVLPPSSGSKTEPSKKPARIKQFGLTL